MLVFPSSFAIIVSTLDAPALPATGCLPVAEKIVPSG